MLPGKCVDLRAFTMTAMSAPLIVSIRGHAPQLHPESWVAPNASVIGQVSLAARVSVWYSATLRAEAEQIEVGFGTNIQDGVTVHVDREFPVRIGAGVSVGHNAVVHGCTVEDDALIGSGAVVLNGALVGTGALVAASALIPQGMVIPARSLVTGVPGRVQRELSAAEVANNRYNAEVYRRLLDLHRASTGSAGC
jgi:carbonic anhydrase/acetyltransferase-like protein (isoleucine patch superfamily)